VIPKRELEQLRAEWSLDLGVIEKDYMLGWLLAGIANHDALSRTWVFKGGTCLRRCYYETFRFSEDLDFTIVDGGPEEPDDLTQIFEEIAEWVREESGIELVVDEKSFQRRKNRRDHPTTQGRVAYRGPNGQSSLPKIKLDLTSDEILVDRPVIRPIGHPYSDSLSARGVLSYSITEALLH
jgi:predicted nucleotidyltransferase component of viral defense system